MEIFELGITKMCEARCKAWARGFIKGSTSNWPRLSTWWLSHSPEKYARCGEPSSRFYGWTAWKHPWGPTKVTIEDANMAVLSWLTNINKLHLIGQSQQTNAKLTIMAFTSRLTNITYNQWWPICVWPPWVYRNYMGKYRNYMGKYWNYKQICWN